jgi:hypothetical protein
MAVCGTKRLVRMALAALPVLLFLTGAAYPAAASAATHPITLRHPFCYCAADFNRDGLADRGSISSQQGSTFIHLALSGRREPLRLHAGKGVVNVLAFDIDRDGDTDLVALKTDLRIRVWLNNGHGEFVRRNQPDPSISFGSKLLTGDSQQTGVCCSSAYDDGVSLAGYARTNSIGPEPSETHGIKSIERPTTDPFLTSIHLRGPPSIFRLTSN